MDIERLHVEPAFEQISQFGQQAIHQHASTEVNKRARRVDNTARHHKCAARYIADCAGYWGDTACTAYQLADAFHDISDTLQDNAGNARNRANHILHHIQRKAGGFTQAFTDMAAYVKSAAAFIRLFARFCIGIRIRRNGKMHDFLIAQESVIMPPSVRHA